MKEKLLKWIIMDLFTLYIGVKGKAIKNRVEIVGVMEYYCFWIRSN